MDSLQVFLTLFSTELRNASATPMDNDHDDDHHDDRYGTYDVPLAAFSGDRPLGDQRRRGSMRGWGGLRPDGTRYRQGTKTHHQEPPKRPKTRTNQNRVRVLERDTKYTTKYASGVDGDDEVWYDDDGWDRGSFSDCTEIGVWDRMDNPLPSCTNPHDAWILMQLSPKRFEAIYAAWFGGFITMGYRETYNVVSTIVWRWVDEERSSLAREFVTSFFGEDYLMRRTPWVFTKTSRKIADELFGVSEFHEKLKQARAFICVNRVKQVCSERKETGGYAIPFKEWEQLLNKVNNPSELLHNHMHEKIPMLLHSKYKEWLEEQVFSMRRRS